MRGVGPSTRPSSPKLREPLADLRVHRAGRDRRDDDVGQLPVELLRDLERERLRALCVVRAQADVDEAPGQLERELDGQAAAIVVRATDGVDRRAVDGRGDELLGLEVVRAEDRRLHAFGGGPGSDGVREVARRGARERVEPELLRLGGGDRDHAILERVGRVRGVELQVELPDPERRGEPRRSDQRRAARREPGSAGAATGRSVDVAPERRRPGSRSTRA